MDCVANIYDCMTLDKLFNLSVPQSPHLQKWSDNNKNYLIEFLCIKWVNI